MKVLVLQPYVNRCINDLEKTALDAVSIFQIANKVNVSYADIIFIPDEVKRLFNIEDLNQEDKILGNNMFIFGEYIKLFDSADIIILLTSNFWFDKEVNIFDSILFYYYSDNYENKVFRLPLAERMIPDYDSYRENLLEDQESNERSNYIHG